MSTMSSRSDLHRADHPSWRRDSDYNPDVRAPLATAYALIRRGPDRVASFREAGYRVLALRDRPMSPQQRMNACYILGMAHAADDEYPQAMPWLDRAVALARALGDGPAEADLLFLRGSVAQRMDHYGRALHDYRVALDLHATLRRDLRGEHPAVDREQELLLLVWAAGYALTQEEYALTRRLLSAARRAARGVAAAPSAVAYHDWFRATYLEARGQPERALQAALRAAATSAQEGAEPYAVVLIHAFVARLAADLAATHGDGSVGRVAHLEMAALSLRAARRALAPNDRSGPGFIETRQARLDSLRGREVRALERIRTAEQLARQLGDGPLLVQALTVHGQILERRPESWGAALGAYRDADVISRERGFPLGGLPARRALRRLEELHGGGAA